MHAFSACIYAHAIAIATYFHAQPTACVANFSHFASLDACIAIAVANSYTQFTIYHYSYIQLTYQKLPQYTIKLKDSKHA